MKKEMITVVLADNDADDRSFVIEAIKELQIQHKLVEVENGAELIDLLFRRGKNQISEAEPDFVLLDINMPKVDGLTALEQIKKHSDLKEIPIYILSTSDNLKYMKRAHELGASRYYKKSGNFQNLKTLIHEICNECLIS